MLLASLARIRETAGRILAGVLDAEAGIVGAR
jgi:hypothetical protein